MTCTCLSISRDPLCVFHGDADKVGKPELLAAIRAMVASYDGLRDVLTCKTVIAKVAAADAAIAKAEGRS